ncbi:MAG: hypothetical protein IJ583_15925, partial [Firmicutes bacterium]|nr:hypothetical protein [Bacillota bacterium]
ENIMNDCAFPVSYVTRVSNIPFSPISGQQFHLIYLPSTHNWSDTQEDTTGYGTQIAIGSQAFPTSDWDKAPFSRGLQIYMRSGTTRKRFADDSDTNRAYANELNLKFSGNENIKDMNKYPYIATGWSNWVKINTAENITTTYVNATNGNYAVNISASNVQNAILKLAEQICSAKSSAGTLSSSLNSHTGATNSAHASSAISVDAITSTTYGDNTLTTGKSNVLNVLKDIYNRLAYNLYREDNINDTLKTHRTAETRSGSKHIPSGGSWNKTLKYSESGTAVWTPSPYTYQKIEQPIAYNKWYKLVLCNFSSGHRYGGGFAIITVTAYNSLGKGQTVACRAAYSGGTGDFQLLHSVCRDENSKVFDKVSYVRLNYGFIAFHAAASISDITMNITVESSISEERVDFKANDNEWDTTDDGSWVWTRSGQHYWNDIDL